MRTISYLGWIVFFILSLFFDIGLAFYFPQIWTQNIDRIFLIISNEIFILVLALIISLSFVYYKNKTLIRFWLTLAFTFISINLLKIIVLRPRPFIVFNYFPLANPIYVNSFPSLSTGILFSMLPFMEKSYPGFKLFWWIIALLISLGRLYIGVHFISDIMFGAFLGYLIGDLILNHTKDW